MSVAEHEQICYTSEILRRTATCKAQNLALTGSAIVNVAEPGANSEGRVENTE